ncbi:MAG: MerR family transcriptional regulator [Gammaproteobacteria bacterium]|nr:MerR family transcriptional regulator [Gammaproteobacteria bacterium]
MLTRGKLAKKVGCNIETIRYYEKIGLLPIPNRGVNGYRQYDEEHLKRLRFILRAKELGFSGDAIKNLMKITNNIDDFTKAEVKNLTEAHISDISRRIDDLRKLKKTLISFSNHCDGSNESAEHCPIINSIYNSSETQVKPRCK